MNQIFEVIYPDTPKSEFCASDSSRFSWLRQIICEKYEEYDVNDSAEQIDADYIDDDNVEYMKTGKAVPPRGSTNKNDIGYFPPGCKYFWLFSFILGN